MPQSSVCSTRTSRPASAWSPGTGQPSAVVSYGTCENLSVSLPERNPKRRIRFSGADSARTVTANTPLPEMNSCVSESLLMATARRGGASVTCMTAFDIWPLSRVPLREATM